VKLRAKIANVNAPLAEGKKETLKIVDIYDYTIDIYFHRYSKSIKGSFTRPISEADFALS
jgi:hypothetical protein